MYSNLNTADPPSLVPPMSLGVWISVKPWARRAERKRKQTEDCSRKMALLAGVRKSSARLSSRVSWPTRAKPSPPFSKSFSDRLASSKVKGSLGSALDTQCTFTTSNSMSFCVHPSTGASGALTIACTSMMLSRLSPATYFTMLLLTVVSFTNKTAWTVEVCCLSTKNADLPLDRTVCTRARTSTEDPMRFVPRASTRVHTRPEMHWDCTRGRSP
mmetsp:Transcript_29880/g.41343  ORF Transcript_29880/g.41343 Transcript_29880/m.41343 type:complete len:215 (-) Transcript_29880:409-1053(-)